MVARRLTDSILPPEQGDRSVEMARLMQRCAVSPAAAHLVKEAAERAKYDPRQITPVPVFNTEFLDGVQAGDHILRWQWQTVTVVTGIHASIADPNQTGAVLHDLRVRIDAGNRGFYFVGTSGTWVSAAAIAQIPPVEGGVYRYMQPILTQKDNQFNGTVRIAATILDDINVQITLLGVGLYGPEGSL